jgi:acyl carrier protein
MNAKNKIKSILKKNFKLKSTLISKLFSNKISIINIPHWDSLKLLKFYLTIEKEFDVKINGKNFDKLNNLNKIIKFLKK